MPTYLIMGVLAAVAAGFLELAASLIAEIVPAPSGNDWTFFAPFLGLLVFAIIEESVKLATIGKLIRRFPSEAAFTLSLVLFGIGFGGTEIFIARAMFPEMPVPALVGIPTLHLVTALLYGYAVRQNVPKLLWPASFLLGTLLHFFYNVFLA